MIDLALDMMIGVFVLWIIAVCVKIMIGPGIENRLVALNVLSGLVLGLLVLIGAQKRSAIFLDVALVYDIFGFLGFLAMIRFLDKHLKTFRRKSIRSKK
jgi:multicomponent Na+:H+ antiporter subunit F